MTKYTRSLENLTTYIKDIFNEPGISIDTKVIMLVLAATMDRDKFIIFITKIEHLAAIRSTFIEISNIRNKYGELYRDFIILSALKHTQRDVNSDELQRFIREVDGNQFQLNDTELAPALSLNELNTQKNWQQQIDRTAFIATQNKAAKFLIEKLSYSDRDHLQTITDAYLHCRSQENPLAAYYAVIYVMADILTASGLDSKYSLLYSYKLARKALDKFLQHPTKNSILHSFNTSV